MRQICLLYIAKFRYSLKHHDFMKSSLDQINTHTQDYTADHNFEC